MCVWLRINNVQKSGCVLSDLPPLQLIFEQPVSVIQARLDEFLANNPVYWRDEDRNLHGSVQYIRHGCLSFEIDVSDRAADLAGFRPVFCQSFPSSTASLLAIDLGDGLAGGQRSPPIAASLLAFAATLAEALQCKAVKWNPGQLVSDPAFFIECIENYIENGTFAVLVTVDFEIADNDDILTSRGLSWFSGQEIELSGCGLSGSELVRRAVRLVHDIATKGPVFLRQHVPDLEPDRQIELIPPMAGEILQCRITAKSEHEHGVTGM